jgi:Phage capsid protein
MIQIPDHYVVQFDTNWQHLLQQMESRLKEKTKLVSAQGASVRFNQYGLATMSQVTTRNASTTQSASTLPTRWAYPVPYDIANVFSEFDNLFLGSVVLPTSECMQSQAAAYGRLADKVLIDALTAAATITTPNTATGFVPNGAPTTVALPAGQTVAVNYVPAGGTPANSGLTIGKIREAKRILDANEAPAEDRVLIVSAKEISDLLGTTEVTNNLYNSVRALVDGDVDAFLGFKIVRSEQLNLPSVGIRTCVAYHKNAAVLVDGGKKSYMDILPTQSHSLQIRSTAVLGATRLLETGVVQILADTTK